MKTLVVALALLTIAVAIPAPASAACSPMLDLARVCVTAGTSPAYVCVYEKFGGESSTKCTPLVP